MLEAAVARGYEYYAVTDHSHYLRDGRLDAQLEEIEALRERFPQLTILAGVEANIRSNGEVDMADEDLAKLDWVVASVHNAPTTARPSACSRRWRTRTSTASGTSPGGGSTSARRATSTSSA